jgi:primosomal protein N' (replication factor Y)
MPSIRMVDTRADRPEDGLTHALKTALRERLARGEQSLVFLNRRGYAPVLYCRACTWHSECKRCSANLVLHRAEGRLRCHHCGHATRVPASCPDCRAEELAPLGQGTQRIEEVIADAVPGARIARVDRDATVRKGALAGVLEAVREGEIDILVGTQMLAKGHDYPNLTLVGVLGSDGALFSSDFRAAERLYALLTQVAGRAGRGKERGEVIIQTDFAVHALYRAVARGDFDAFAAEALAERESAQLPPFGHLALLRVESKKPGEAIGFAEDARRIAGGLGDGVDVYEPVPAVLERKAGFERAQLLVRAARRAALQAFLRAWRPALAARTGHRVRWSLDVDPQET